MAFKNFSNVLERGRPFKVFVNIGACLDIPTGRYTTGIHGESILNGGLANLTGLFGMGNSFKSTIMHYMTLSAQCRMNESYIGTYDTEMNIQEWRLSELGNSVQRALDFDECDLISDGTWAVTDKSKYAGNKWYAQMRDYMKEKSEKPNKDDLRTTPFVDRDGSGLKITLPAFVQVDSFSEISTDAVEKMQDSSEVGESGQNAVSLKQGQHKNQMLMELPGLTVGSDTYMFLTAHFGDVYALNPQSPPQKKLSELQADKKIKGVPEKFTFVTQNCWWTKASSSLLNQGTKQPEFPRDSNDDRRGDTDLKTVTLHQVRGKSGLTGIQVTVVVSQTLGVLPSLTEFYYIKENGRFGINGSLQNYELDLLPGVKLSRTTVRRKIDERRDLRRALNITSELGQMQQYWYHIPEVMITPSDLRKKIEAEGFDWDFILNQTRGWWALEEDTRQIGLFLSTMDLINMVTPDKNDPSKMRYFPYWLEKDKKTVKKQYQKLLRTDSGVRESTVSSQDKDLDKVIESDEAPYQAV